MFRSNTGPTPAAVPLGLGSPPAPHCPPVRAAAQGSKGQQAVCEHQLTEIVYSLFPVRRIGIGRPPPPAPGSGPPWRPSAWPLPLNLSAPLHQLLNLRGKLVPVAGRGRKSLLVAPSLLAHVI